jgi:hypothetical protein
MRQLAIVVVAAALSVGCGGAQFVSLDQAPAQDDGAVQADAGYRDDAPTDPVEATLDRQAASVDGSSPARPDAAWQEGGQESGDDGGVDAPRTCVSDLSGVGTGDFRVSFTIATIGAPASYMALLNQRTHCDDTKPGWDVWMTAAGDLGIEVFDGAAGSYDNVTHDGRAVNDGAPHHIAVSRSGGGTVLTVSVDGVARSYPGEPAMSLGALAPMNEGSDPTCTGVSPISGQLSDVCVSR